MEGRESGTTPLDAATVAVPDSVPPPGLAPIATVMLAAELVTVLLNESCTTTCTAGPIDTPAVTAEGWTENPSLEAAAGLMVNADEVVPVRAPEAAVSV